MTEQESFWDYESFAVVTDGTKPAMKWTIEELKGRGKRIFVVDLSDRPEEGSTAAISDLPSGIDCAVIGLTSQNPVDAVEEIRKKGINKLWIHWRTDTIAVNRKCQESELQCITGRCPMMYLANDGLNMHSMQRALAKILRKY